MCLTLLYKMQRYVVDILNKNWWLWMVSWDWFGVHPRDRDTTWNPAVINGALSEILTSSSEYLFFFYFTFKIRTFILLFVAWGLHHFNFIHNFIKQNFIQILGWIIAFIAVLTTVLGYRHLKQTTGIGLCFVGCKIAIK